jgi:hypothetical protein
MSDMPHTQATLRVSKEAQEIITQTEYLAFKRWHFASFLVILGIILGLLAALCMSQYRITYILTHTVKRIHGDTGHLLSDLEL